MGGSFFSLEASVRGASRAAETYLDMRDAVQFDARLQMFHALDFWGLPGFLTRNSVIGPAVRTATRRAPI